MEITNKERRFHARKAFKKPRCKLEPVDLSDKNTPEWMTRAFKNNRVTVMIDDNVVMSDGTVAIKAMVQRHDDKPIPKHWAEMQRIKNEIFGLEAVGVEYYPSESKLLNDHNIYWLWIFQEGDIPVWR